MSYRIIKFSFNNKDEAIDFIELINTQLKTANLIVDLKGNIVSVKIYGTKDEIKGIISELKDLLSLVRSREKGAFLKVSIKHLLSSVNLKASIPINLILEIVQMKGYEIRMNKGYLVTNASFELLKDIAIKLSNAYFKLKNIQATPKAKRIIALYSLLFDKDINDSIKELHKMRIINVIKDLGRYTLSSNYEEAVDKIKNLLKQSSKNVGGKSK